MQVRRFLSNLYVVGKGSAVCKVLGDHVPYIDLSQCTAPEPGVIVGPITRYCGRCGKILPGDEFQVGDRTDPRDIYALPESLN